jgi:hypothetical protein
LARATVALAARPRGAPALSPLRARGLFDSWLHPKRTCPQCGQLIERPEEGYFLGSLLVNLVIAEVLPLATIVFVVVRASPHSPWNLILYGGAALAS